MNWDEEHPGYRAELGRRLLEAVTNAASKKVVADRAGISVEQLNKWMGLSGDTPPKVPVSGLLAVAEATGVDFYWLATGEAKNVHLSLEDLQTAIEDRDVAHIPRYDVTVPRGEGAFIDHAKMLDMIPFPLEFFNRRLGRGPDGMAIVDARGDSMEPTIGDRDQVMIDTTDTQLTPAIWGFALDDVVMVKRLQQTPQGIEIVSDNTVYGRQLVEPSRQDGFRLIGRVVWVGRVL